MTNEADMRISGYRAIIGERDCAVLSPIALCLVLNLERLAVVLFSVQPIAMLLGFCALF